MCRSNLFKHFLKAIKVVELTTDSGNEFYTEMIRLQKKVTKRVMLRFMFTSLNQSIFTQIASDRLLRFYVKQQIKYFKTDPKMFQMFFTKTSKTIMKLTSNVITKRK